MNAAGLEIRFCGEGDVPAILRLQECVFRDLGEKSDFLRRNTEETFLRCVRPPNFTLGAFDAGDLVALTIMEDARGRDDDLGVRLETHDLARETYADYKLAMVRSDHRGRGLQRRLLRLAEEIAHQKGYRWFCTSVAPGNEHSRVNIRAAGFALDSEKELYGGLRREIYVKRLEGASAKDG